MIAFRDTASSWLSIESARGHFGFSVVIARRGESSLWCSSRHVVRFQGAPRHSFRPGNRRSSSGAGCGLSESRACMAKAASCRRERRPEQRRGAPERSSERLVSYGGMYRDGTATSIGDRGIRGRATRLDPGSARGRDRRWGSRAIDPQPAQGTLRLLPIHYLHFTPTSSSWPTLVRRLVRALTASLIRTILFERSLIAVNRRVPRRV